MRVCLETTALRTKLTGIGNYVLGLANALQNGHSDIELSSFDGLHFSSLETALAQHFDVDGNTATSAEGQILQLARYLKPLRSAFRKAKAIRFEKSMPQIDVFHALNFMPPGQTRTACIPLIYDLSHVRHPETHPKERIDWLNTRLQTLRDYPLINTISEFSADEIAEVYHYPRHQIRVTWPGIKPDYLALKTGHNPIEIAGRVLKPLHYMLTVGTLEPRKNLRSLVEAYSQLHPDERAAFPLVVVGQYGWGQNDIQRAVKLREEGSLIVANYVPERQLSALYANATAFLFPSLYEGFGMPVAEAMACGTPVIASDIPVMKEVGGDHIAMVDAGRSDAWCDAIRKMMTLSQSQREVIVAAARSRASTFTWERNADATSAMYAERLA
jgi:glycosyltransferase involved in cell wall biosynthesis